VKNCDNPKFVLGVTKEEEEEDKMTSTMLEAKRNDQKLTIREKTPLLTVSGSTTPKGSSIFKKSDKKQVEDLKQEVAMVFQSLKGFF